MVFETIKDALVNKLGLEPEIVTENALVEKDLELDSTENVVISLELKKKYGIDYVFSKEDISLGDLCKTVELMLSKNENL